jgi:hypothetical protein
MDQLEVGTPESAGEPLSSVISVVSHYETTNLTEDSFLFANCLTLCFIWYTQPRFTRIEYCPFWKRLLAIYQN